MKRSTQLAGHLFLGCLLPLFLSCTNHLLPSDENDVVPPIEINDEEEDDGVVRLPAPEKTLAGIALSEEQTAFAKAGNAFAFRSFQKLYRQQGDKKNLIYSPLSLQFVLSMLANGASEDTAKEITQALGYGDELTALNDYCHSLMNQLPALSGDNDVRLANTVIVNDNYPLKTDFVRLMNKTFYAPVAYFNGNDIEDVTDLVNEWARINTNGYIDPFLAKGEIDNSIIAILLNALYFKAKWEGDLFYPDLTKEEDFYPDQQGGVHQQVKMMYCNRVILPYAEMDGYRVTSIPYENEHFDFYILLPDTVGGDGLAQLVKKISAESWQQVLATLKTPRRGRLRFPQIETEQKFDLKAMLESLQIHKIFLCESLDHMFEMGSAQVSKILQKARISVKEGGTEAAAVTGALFAGASGYTTEPEQEFEFTANHPFMYLITERSTGLILFQGTYGGQE